MNCLILKIKHYFCNSKFNQFLKRFGALGRQGITLLEFS